MANGEQKNDGATTIVMPPAHEQDVTEFLEAIRTRGGYILQVKANPAWMVTDGATRRAIRTARPTQQAGFAFIEATALGLPCDKNTIRKYITTNDVGGIKTYWGGA